MMCIQGRNNNNVSQSPETIPPVLELRVRSLSGARLRPLQRGIFEVVIENKSNFLFSWVDANPVRLSYRIFDKNRTNVIVIDGARVGLERFLEPGERRTYLLPVQMPDMGTEITLCISLVCEGAFWFYERYNHGWTDISVAIDPEELWSDNNLSIATRILRGSIVAFNLKNGIPDLVCYPVQSDAFLPNVLEEKYLIESSSEKSNSNIEIGENSNEMGAAGGRFVSRVVGIFCFALRPLRRLVRRHIFTRIKKSFSQVVQVELANMRQGLSADMAERQLINDAWKADLQSEMQRLEYGIRDLRTVAAAIVQGSADDRKLLTVISEQQERAHAFAVNSTNLHIQLNRLVEDLKLGSVANEQRLDVINSGLSRHLLGISELMPHAFAKLDNLLVRQSFAVPAVDLMICRNRLGLLAIPEEDLETIAYFCSGVEPEPGTLSLVERMLKPGDCFVDVGANVGLFTIAAARKIGATGKVIAFEPAPRTVEALRASLRLNGISDFVEVHQAAGGDITGSAMLHVSQICGHTSLLPVDSEVEQVKVPTVRLDDVIDCQPVKMIKIDVEGWEIPVLMGLARTIAANPEIMIIAEFGPSHIHRQGTTVHQWIEAVRKLGLELFEIDESDGDISPFRSSGFDEIFSINLLLTKALPMSLRSSV